MSALICVIYSWTKPKLNAIVSFCIAKHSPIEYMKGVRCENNFDIILNHTFDIKRPSTLRKSLYIQVEFEFEMTECLLNVMR